MKKFKNYLGLLLVVLLTLQSIPSLAGELWDASTQESDLFGDLEGDASPAAEFDSETDAIYLPSEEFSVQEDFISGESLEPSSQENTVYLTYIPWIETNHERVDYASEVDRLKQEGQISTQEIDADAATAIVGANQTFNSVNEAVEYVRKQLVKRTASFGFTVNGLSYSTSSDLWGTFLNDAQVHTGVGDEGDYIAWHIGASQGQISGNDDYVTYTYNVQYYTSASQEQQVTSTLKSIYSQYGFSSMPYVKRIKAIYDFIMERAAYDYANLNNESYQLQYTAYACLINRTSVCQGYGNLLCRMLLDNGVACRSVVGVANSSSGSGRHLWNLIGINGTYYNADVTWDDQPTVTYSYFLKSASVFNVDHFRDSAYTTSSFNQSFPTSGSDYDWQSNLNTEIDGGNGDSDGDENEFSDDDEDEGDDDEDEDEEHSNASYLIGKEVEYDDGVYEILTEDCAEFVRPVNKKTKEVVIPESIEAEDFEFDVISIADKAYKGNKYLTSIYVGDNVYSIGDNAFYKCTKLNYVAMPSVESIGKKAFYGCKKLDTILVGTDNLTSSSIGAKAFTSIYSKAVFYVPEDCLSSYKKLFKKKGAGKKCTYEIYEPEDEGEDYEDYFSDGF